MRVRSLHTCSAAPFYLMMWQKDQGEMIPSDTRVWKSCGPMGTLCLFLRACAALGPCPGNRPPSAQIQLQRNKTSLAKPWDQPAWPSPKMDWAVALRLLTSALTHQPT
ncbi:hypothetical protein Pyn_14824 [Prunus yedoensis var. nudiflora]|uniref:Uncharacterized protein n=1 Tax=Prunus yedoensis var. nudiflora TaxID=2094558 RepID=A0A314YTH2_PRUYE|nr:hypothetical protein Pyn_14824 [Prunus yedoensis var. nudiflora]